MGLKRGVMLDVDSLKFSNEGTIDKSDSFVTMFFEESACWVGFIFFGWELFVLLGD